MADTLGVLDATAFALGEWETQRQTSSKPWLDDTQVGWETEVAELLTRDIDVVRPLLTDSDPEVRSMAAALLGDASVE
ncbi:hypothetical protein OG226_50180 [Streptomyces sp. NBC_01261]|uniref:hypothetical protein n=1 Tax=Streptomyces sp. NBC_01261 TaxID=2903802 RepID=UPI002E361B14|nr:hypothetical protein [Streptomyces sp. NBC_01261]